MAKKGKLSKIGCMLKRWNSGRLKRISAGGAPGRSPEVEEPWRKASASFHAGDVAPAGFQQVFVGKSRRRYLVSSDLADHPLFQSLMEGSGCCGGGGAVVGCEVVLFEHLLWMLESADPLTELLAELVDFYTC
ncbi:hypothetical protein AXF42_Ash004104 [Apostasia shenzhenica]|uniref:Uncharacterized protein n=1 Tax=Apostasia shenzhenica TaxID=1088818 RepID=A0A2I0A214_9ASPA|nr:hypothetical protein AXF42_Ash004104 [Apostasia shenzhenica]